MTTITLPQIQFADCGHIAVPVEVSECSSPGFEGRHFVHCPECGQTEIVLLDAAAYRARAQQAVRRSQESWERSDTDGFMSQWANDAMASKYRAMAELAEEGGVSEFPAVFDLDGNLTDFHQVSTRYGMSWVRDTEHGSEWFNESGARKGSTRLANDRKKGYTIGSVRQEATVELVGTLALHPVYKPVRHAPRVVVSPVAFYEDWA